MNSRKRWLNDNSDPNELLQVAALVADINLAHSARSANSASEMLIARLLLKRFSADEIFAQAEHWATSDDVREAIRFNGAVGIVDLKTALDAAQTHKPETPAERAERFRRIDQEDAARTKRDLENFADDLRTQINPNQNTP